MDEKQKFVVEGWGTLFCPRCKKKMFYYRERQNNYKCRKCGSEFVVDDTDNTITVTEQ